MKQNSSIVRTKNSLTFYLQPRMLVILLFGFSSGLPLLLTLSTLSWFLSGYGVDKKTIGLFAFTGLPYTIKPIFAIFIDRIKLPILGNLMGRRKSWLLVLQIFLALSILGVGFIDPTTDLFMLAVMTICVAFFSACQDIVIDAYRIERLPREEFSAGASLEVVGYRLGMIISGAFALYLSDHNSFKFVYFAMAMFMIPGIITTLICKEPEFSEKLESSSKNKTSLTSNNIKDFISNGLINPFLDFMKKPGWYLILLFIVLYRIGDNLIGPMNSVFYKEIGFTGTEIAVSAKAFGIWMTILGAFIGGAMGYRFGIMRTMLIGATLHIMSNIFFIVLAVKGHSLSVLYMLVISENITSGIMACSYTAYLSTLCNRKFTATQFALFTSLFGLARTFFQGCSGHLADKLAWVDYFVIVTLAAVPSIFLLLYLMKKYPLEYLKSFESDKSENVYAT